MAGAPSSSGFPIPTYFGRRFARFYMAGTVFFIAFRIYHDGGHHFLGHHPWDDPKVVAQLEKADEKYGSHLATSNMHH